MLSQVLHAVHYGSGVTMAVVYQLDGDAMATMTVEIIPTRETVVQVSIKL